MTTLEDVLEVLHANANAKNVEGMARYGFKSKKALGISAPFLHKYAKKLGTNHRLALKLWPTQILEARALAALIGDPRKATKTLMNSWVKEFDNWAVCDAVCCNLFDKTPFAVEMAMKWTTRKEEFVRRAGFVTMAALAVHDKEASDRVYTRFLPVVKRESRDERNFVKKAANWALRQIGKRNKRLNSAAIRTAREIHKINSSSARWIAADALRELESKAVQRRLVKKRRD
jgi:3-methyladenine DNA glycosylase AlkD